MPIDFPHEAPFVDSAGILGILSVPLFQNDILRCRRERCEFKRLKVGRFNGCGHGGRMKIGRVSESLKLGYQYSQPSRSMSDTRMQMTKVRLFEDGAVPIKTLYSTIVIVSCVRSETRRLLANELGDSWENLASP
jgi:hypothetical protein